MFGFQVRRTISNEPDDSHDFEIHVVEKNKEKWFLVDRVWVNQKDTVDKVKASLEVHFDKTIQLFADGNVLSNADYWRERIAIGDIDDYWRERAAIELDDNIKFGWV